MGSFDESALITNAIEIGGNIVGIMRNGKFGRIEFDGRNDCSFIPLSKSKYESTEKGRHFLWEN